MENNDITTVAHKAKEAFLKTMSMNNETKNKALELIKEKLLEKKELLYSANRADSNNAKQLLEENKINQAAFDRLKFNGSKIRELIKGIDDLIKMDDPVNKPIWQKELDEGLILKKISTPIGVIGVIFESRPDCFIQISSLIIKSGNCAILKGGSECQNTNKALHSIVQEALKEAGMPENTINSVYSRDDIKKMLSLDKDIDLIIPRGSNSLVQFIQENTKIPVLGHASGICHTFVDENADFENTKKIIIDAKTQYPSACNATETLLIHKNYPYINELKEALKKSDIELIENPLDYHKEYSDRILAIKIVNDLDEAIEHINKYGSGHTDAIISKKQENIEKFMNLVDSSSVFANCSTRFSDGYRYGFGAEVGISTNKTHARGPVGLEGLTIYKYKLYGSNNIVDGYTKGIKTFKHKFI